MTDINTIQTVTENERPVSCHVVFTGTTPEYFRIWIVNVALTMVTLGVYYAWAKVRNRRYFYSNTILDQHPFSYLAAPKAVFIGHAVVFGALFVANFFGGFSPVIGSLVTILFYAAIPFLVYKAHRFRAHNSGYRGLTFRFLGGLQEAYKVYFVFPGISFLALLLLIYVQYILMAGNDSPGFVTGFLFILSLMAFMLLLLSFYPYWVYLKRCYAFKNVAYGSLAGNFTPKLRMFYRYYAVGFLIFFAAILVVTPFISQAYEMISNADNLGTELFVGALILWVVYGGIFVFLKQYLTARLTKHCWENLTFGDVSFRVDIQARKLGFIGITNIVAIILSFGMLMPWARIRQHKYIVECFTVIAKSGLDHFSAKTEAETRALGEAVADYFDWDLGW